MYELVNIFESFLPQLLTYPNPADPLNIEAANLLNTNPTEYERKVRVLVQEHAGGPGPKVASVTKEVIESRTETAPKEEDKPQVAQPDPTTSSQMDEELDELSNRSDLSSLSETSDMCEEAL